ncbi:MAG: PDZ domain-containing protein [Longimicrobiales bacterium]
MTRTAGALLLVLLAGATPPRADDEVRNVRYDVTFDAASAASRTIRIEMSFDVTNGDAVSLSLPSWTPGSYSLGDFAKNVGNVRATQSGAEIRWDKADFDTWRVYPTGRGRVSVALDYAADELDNGQAWSRPDFAFFNGTNVFFYPEGADLDFSSEIVFHTEADWKIATGLTAGPATRSYSAVGYHELVDMPTFVGRFDVDSAQIGGKWYRLATYPEGRMAGQDRALLWDQIHRMMPPMEAVTDVVPWDHYTTLLVFDESFGGGSALEHSNSHLGIYHPTFLGSPTLASITAHEIFHGWNVKRMRPWDLWPYDYGRAMPTELLWVSEGITDYYADLALVRGGIVSAESFYEDTQAKIEQVTAVPPVALEDASLSTWISPRDGTASIYYPKGSLAGLMLDILIRDASDNARSLDDVMKTVYEGSYGRDRGFTEEQWWDAVQSAAGGRSFQDFHDDFIDGRVPFPWETILPLAGLQLRVDVTRVPRIGISTQGSAEGVRVAAVGPGSAAQAAGIVVGDLIVSVAGVDVGNADFGAVFRANFANGAVGTRYEIVVERAGQRLTLSPELRFDDVRAVAIEEDAGASPKAVRIRNGLLTGSAGN